MDDRMAKVPETREQVSVFLSLDDAAAGRDDDVLVIVGEETLEDPRLGLSEALPAVLPHIRRDRSLVHGLEERVDVDERPAQARSCDQAQGRLAHAACVRVSHQPSTDSLEGWTYACR